MEIDRLIKRYGEKTVLNINRLNIPENTACALLGENGSGKSTLLKILAGVLAPDAGSFRPAPTGGDFFYMPQKPYAFHMPVWKSVTLGIGGNKREAALPVLSQVGAARLINKRETALSGGEAQRVAFARLLLKPRALVLLDEPSSALDQDGTALMEAALRAYMAANNATVIFATHSKEQAARLADLAVVLRNGEIVAINHFTATSADTPPH